jgi:hypothetical protein
LTIAVDAVPVVGVERCALGDVELADVDEAAARQQRAQRPAELAVASVTRGALTPGPAAARRR